MRTAIAVIVILSSLTVVIGCGGPGEDATKAVPSSGEGTASQKVQKPTVGENATSAPGGAAETAAEMPAGVNRDGY